MASVLIIEDDADLNDVMAVRLGREGHACVQAWSGTEALLRLDRERFDLIVCDLMLPGSPGETIVEALRARADATPVLVVSARMAPMDKVTLLKLGADDYLAKPFDLDELAARVAVQLRHAERLQAASVAGSPAAAFASASSAPPLAFGRWTLDADAFSFCVDGEPVSLTPMEFALMETMMRQPSKAFTKQELFEAASGEPYMVEDNTLNVHVSHIRAKLKPSGTDACLVTVWGVGFKLVERS